MISPDTPTFRFYSKPPNFSPKTLYKRETFLFKINNKSETSWKDKCRVSNRQDKTFGPVGEVFVLYNLIVWTL